MPELDDRVAIRVPRELRLAINREAKRLHLKPSQVVRQKLFEAFELKEPKR